MISKMRKITLQSRLSTILMFHLTLWNTLHMILTPEAMYKVAKPCLIFSQKTLFIILTLNMASQFLTARKIKSIITALAYYSED